MRQVKLVISIFALIPFTGCGQDKIERVFNNNFEVLYNEDPNIYNAQDDTLCAYFEKRFMVLDFFENVTGILLERKTGVGANGMARIESIEVFKKWESWYKREKGTLVWVDDTTKIQLPNAFVSSCFNYVDSYPNQVRFKDELGKVPYNPKVYSYEVQR